MRRLIAMILALVTLMAAMAQNATVERMTPAPTDLTASKYRRTDMAGHPCALVKVEMMPTDAVFTGNIVGDVQHTAGEYWVYLSPGTKMLRVQSASFMPLMVNFRDHGVNEVEPLLTYVLTISAPQPAQPARPASASYNYLVLKVSPQDAKVTVDGKPAEVRAGVAKVLLRHGTYTYHVEAPGYLPQDGQVQVSQEKAERTVTLASTKGTLSVTAATPGTEIYINSERVGADRWQGTLLPGSYLIEGRKASHRNAEEVVQLATGDKRTVTLPQLAPITGSLNVDYEPAGASITIDGKPYGTTPNVIPDLLIGPHTVSITHPDYIPNTNLSATITEGEMAVLSGSLSTAPTQINSAASSYYVSGENLHLIKKSYSSFRDVKTKKYGYIDYKTNDTIIQPKYEDAGSELSPNMAEGLTYVKYNGKYGFIDINDNFIIPAEYEDACYFSDGLARVKINGYYGFIDINNNIVIPAIYRDTYYYWFIDGVIAVKTDDKWGLIDKYNNIIVPEQYDLIYEFENGLAGVKLDNKYGFIDTNGNVKIPIIYDLVENFHDVWGGNEAQVWLNGEEFWIDRNGNRVN